MLGSLKIGARIRGGFAVVLVLLVALALVGVFSARTQRSLFVETTALDRTNNNVGDVSLAFAIARRYVLVYLANGAGDDDAAGQAAKYKAKLDKLFPDLIAQTSDAGLKTDFTKAQADTAKFFAAFERIKAITAKQNDRTAVLSKFGPKLTPT